ncbi:MAG TPA: sigma 54-interacting transcriptional regulator [Terriglobia bacterium]|nr:sigma 54-interacting transcriptional regulator [Terriglobia bacterium]
MSACIPTASFGSVTEQYEALFRVSQSLISACCSEKLFGILVRELRQVLDFDYLGVGIYDEKAHEVKLKSFDRSGASIRTPKLAPEETMTWWAYQRQQPLIAPSVIEETRFAPAMEVLKKLAIRSACALPLTTANRRLGGLVVGSQKEDAISQEEVCFLSLLANQVALAVDAALSFDALEQAQRELEAKHEELEAKRNRLELLLDVTNQVVSNLERREVLRAIAASVRRVMRCDGVGVSLLDSESNQLQLYALDFPGSRGSVLEGDSHPMDEDSPVRKVRWLTRALRTGQPMTLQASDLAELDPADPIATEGIRCLCLLPMISRDRPLGVLGLARRDDNPFTKDEVEFLTQVARQVAIAVENAKAYRRIADLKDKLAREKVYLEDEIRTELNFEHIVGQSAALRQALQQVETVAPTESTVLIYGETGSGKELIARAIHERSLRRSGAFVKLNCAAIPTGLLESELFGHEKGAFTGAIAQRIGRFELANGGTIFLDEIGEVPLELQPKLLRVLQEREFERLGNSRTLRTDARLIAATNRDLAALVEEGKFRSDLFYRLNVFPINVPPLRERSEDIPLLVRHFAQEFSRRMNKRIDTIPSETLRALTRYHWPGNIRELQNMIERAVILSNGAVLKVPLPELKQRTTSGNIVNRKDTLEEAERKHILSVLEETHWVLAGPQGAATRLGMKRSTLQYRMGKLGIARQRPQPGQPA